MKFIEEMRAKAKADPRKLVLPEGTSRVVQLGTQLYAVGDDVLVALR